MSTELLITDGHVVEFHYTLTTDTQEVVDTTDGRAPLAYIHGKNNIVPGLEKEMTGKKVGDKFQVTVAPKDGYGEKNPDMVQAVPKDKFPTPDIELGMQFRMVDPMGRPFIVEVVAIENNDVILDANHPLAGKNLNFAIEVTSIRLATEEEMHHGHLHMGAGCCGGGSCGEGECGDGECADESDDSCGGGGCCC